MANESRTKERIAILDEIVRQVEPLKPPVVAFERSIRRTGFRVLISVLLSARTRDPVTKEASEKLFNQAATAAEIAELDEGEIAQLIYPVGFYKQKAAHIKKIAELMKERDEIPASLEELTQLPGVGRKTANLVLALAFNQPAIAVDIHVFRISKRLGWASGSTPDKVEEELRNSFPPGQWIRINQTLVGFGQTLCKPKGPLCDQCSITDHCNYFKEVQTG